MESMMNVGFYGHSNCAYRSADSLIDIVADNLQANIVNIGVRQGSEERILFELKKTKNLDLAVIFHSQPHFIFIPNADRDMSIRQISNNKSQYFFQEHMNAYHQLHHKKFVELFGDAKELESAITHLKEYFYHPDLQMNRFYGSLIQIDQYLTSKSIPALHIISQNTIPSWFKFSSGIVDTEIMQLIHNYELKPGEWFVNVMNKEGNIAVANKILKLVEEVRFELTNP